MFLKFKRRKERLQMVISWKSQADEDAPLASVSTKNKDFATSNKIVENMTHAQQSSVVEEQKQSDDTTVSVLTGTMSVGIASVAPKVEVVEDIDGVIEPVIAGVQDTSTTGAKTNHIAGSSTLHEHKDNNVGMGKTIFPQPTEDCNLVIPLGSTGITISKIYTNTIRNELVKVNTLWKQKGISQCAVVLCPKMHLYLEDIMNDFDVVHGMFALGRVIQVPNQRKNVHEYVIEYDDEHDNTDGWATHLPKTSFVRGCLKKAVDTADRFNWRMSVKKKPKNTTAT